MFSDAAVAFLLISPMDAISSCVDAAICSTLDAWLSDELNNLLEIVWFFVPTSLSVSDRSLIVSSVLYASSLSDERSSSNLIDMLKTLFIMFVIYTMTHVTKAYAKTLTNTSDVILKKSDLNSL